MDRPGIEHRTEIRRANRTTPLWIALAVVAVLAVVLVGSGGGSEQVAPITPPTTPGGGPPTSETLATTSPPTVPTVYGVVRTAAGLVPASTAMAGTRMSGTGPSAAHPSETALVVTEGRLALLTGDGAIATGTPGDPFRSVVCCFDELQPSNEPNHVWGRSGEDAVLVDLDTGPTRIRIPLGGDRVLGPGSFGLVTVSDDGAVRWRRPGFDPLDLPLPEDRVAFDAGGGTVLIAAPAVAGRHVSIERLSIVDGGVRWLDTAQDGGATPAVLSPDGDAVAVRTAEGWRIRDTTTRTELGTLPTGSVPVPVGEGRFAVIREGRLLVSGASELGPVTPLELVAEQSP